VCAEGPFELSLECRQLTGHLGDDGDGGGHGGPVGVGQRRWRFWLRGAQGGVDLGRTVVDGALASAPTKRRGDGCA